MRLTDKHNLIIHYIKRWGDGQQDPCYLMGEVTIPNTFFKKVQEYQLYGLSMGKAPENVPRSQIYFVTLMDDSMTKGINIYPDLDIQSGDAFSH